MIERVLFGVTIVGGATLGLFWPLSKSETPAASPSAIEVTLQRNSDSHFYAHADVNGHEVRFLVDTGASETALTEEDAKRVGIAVDPNRYELLGQGASGMVRGQFVELKDIRLGELRATDAKAVVVQGATVSLLGQPFLESIDEIVIRKGEMVLRKKSDS
jgi:aspartyl protease family protein